MATANSAGIGIRTSGGGELRGHRDCSGVSVSCFPLPRSARRGLGSKLRFQGAVPCDGRRYPQVELRTFLKPFSLRMRLRKAAFSGVLIGENAHPIPVSGLRPRRNGLALIEREKRPAVAGPLFHSVDGVIVEPTLIAAV